MAITQLKNPPSGESMYCQTVPTSTIDATTGMKRTDRAIWENLRPVWLAKKSASSIGIITCRGTAITVKIAVFRNADQKFSSRSITT